MRLKNGIATMAAIATLLGGAALFSQLAPKGYGLPEIEVLEPGETGRRVDEGQLLGNYFPAALQAYGPHPGILLLGGSEGGLGGGAHSIALALQDEGFSVFHIAYFGAPGQSDSLEQIPLELFDQALDWLEGQPGVDPERLAVVGASKGAEAALLVATRRSNLQAIVAGMPSSVAWNGINWASQGQSPHSSWTAAGQDVPTMPFSDWNVADGITSVYRAVEDPARGAQAERAAIPIERASASILLICGEAETMWPACPMSRMIAARSESKLGPQVTILAYDDAGHFLFGPPISPDHPFYDMLGTYGGSVEGNALARADSWPKVITFLKNAMT